MNRKAAVDGGLFNRSRRLQSNARVHCVRCRLMIKRSQILSLLCAVAQSSCALFAQATATKTSHHEELLLATSSFIDVGPPFDYYSLYKLKSTSYGTSIEKIAITPPGDQCLAPATTEVSRTQIPQSIDELLNHKDPCIIPEKALNREVKRCKHCLTFSGIHINVQVQCSEGPRSIRYEVLDRDLFESKPDTPDHTSQTMKLLEIVDQAFGKGDFDKPIFQTKQDISKPIEKDELVQELSTGVFDGLFTSDPVSQLYKDSQQPHRSPNVTITTSTASGPISPKLPIYPPIARAAHLGGIVNIQLSINSDGKVADIRALSGPEMLRGAVLDAAKTWVFPPDAANQSEQAQVKFDLNCNTFTMTVN